jgi:hypothetical protein
MHCAIAARQEKLVSPSAFPDRDFILKLRKCPVSCNGDFLRDKTECKDELPAFSR